MKGLLVLPLVLLVCFPTEEADARVVFEGEGQVVAASGGNELCGVCEVLVKTVEQKLNDLVNANEQEVEQIIDNALCSRLGPLEQFCKNIVKQYIPEIVADLEKGEMNINICQIIKLCKGNSMEEMADGGSSAYCPICKIMVNLVEQKLNDLVNANEQEVEQIIDNAVCSNMGFFKETCEKLVKQYIPEIVSDLEKGEKNIDICAIIKICQAKQMEMEVAAAGGGLFCQKCQDFVKEAEQMLNNLINANEQEVEQILDNAVCSRLGPLKTACVNIIKMYLPKIVAAIEKGEGALNICAIIKLCPEQAIVEPVQTVQMQGGLFCDKCQAFVHQAEQMLNNLLNANEQQIESILDKEVCARLGPLKDYCMNAIKQYIPVIVALIEKGEGNINICAIIHLCQGQMEMEAMKATVDFQSGLFCDKCQKFVKKAEDMLNNLLNANEQQIEAILDKEVCARLGFLQNYCMNAIKQYIPVIVQLIEKGEGNINLCAIIKLCPQGSFRDAFYMQQPGFTCDICQVAWKSLEGFVKKELVKLEAPIEQKIEVLCTEVGKLVPFLKKTCDLAVQDLVPDVVQWLSGELDHLPFCQDIHVC